MLNAPNVQHQVVIIVKNVALIIVYNSVVVLIHAMMDTTQIVLIFVWHAIKILGVKIVNLQLSVCLA